MTQLPADPLAEFLSQRTFAVVGASSSRAKFGNIVYRDLRQKGFTVFPVNPREETIEGDPCVADLRSLPEKVDGLVVVTPPAVTEQIVREAAEAGIGRIWMQQGAESDAAIALCREHGITAIHGVCVMVQSR